MKSLWFVACLSLVILGFWWISHISDGAIYPTVGQEAEQGPPAPKKEIPEPRFKTYFVDAIPQRCQVFLIHDRKTGTEYLLVPNTGICTIPKSPPQTEKSTEK